ncbi:thioredoxin trx1 [Aspergillus fumigatus]
MPISSIVELVTDEEYKRKVEHSVEPVVVTFLTSLDDKCKIVTSHIGELSDEYTTIKFYQVDVRKHALLSRTLSNAELPIVTFVKNGREFLTLTSGFSLESIPEGLQTLQAASM